MKPTTTAQRTEWTIAYRPAGQPYATRVFDFEATWMTARATAEVLGTRRPDLEVWYVNTALAEMTGRVDPEHRGVIVDNATGERIPLADCVTLEDAGLSFDDPALAEAVADIVLSWRESA